MASPLEAIVVRFGAEWTGGAAINRIVSDINRMVSAGKQAGDALSMTKMLSGIESHDKAIAASAVALGRWQASLKMVQGAINSLGMEVATGGMSEEDAATKYLQLSKAAKEIEKEIAAATPAVAGFGASLAAAMPYIIAAGAALAGLAKGFQMWRESAEMGASIRQTGKSFEYLSSNIYQVPGLLQSMREASRGTIADMQLMSSFMTLVAGTTPTLGTALANATPQLLEIAKAANALNPTLGDTTFFFESLARGIKRSEIRLIDNLGLNLKIGDANKRWAEHLGKTVKELTAEERQMAILNETLRVGSNLVNQLGGDIDSLTDPYLQWDAQAQNIKNSLHELASISFAPLAAEGAKLIVVWADFAKTLVGVAESMDFSARPGKNFDALFKELTKTLGVGFVERIVPVISSLKGATQGMNDFTNAVNASKVGISFETWFSAEFERNVTGFINKWLELAGLPTIDLTGRVKGVDAFMNLFAPGLESSSRDVHREMEESLKAVGEAAKVAEAARAARQEYYDYMNQLRDQMPDSRIQELAASALERQTAAIEKYNEAIAAAKQLQSGSWMDIFAGGEFNSDLIVGDIRNIGTAWIATGGATKEQADKIADLNKQMEKAREKLWDMENGIGVQGDKAEATAKKIADLRSEIANYEQVISGIQQGIALPTEKKINVGLNVNDLEAYKQFINMMGEWNAPVDQLAAVAQGLGLISPAAADAMLKMTLLQGAMDKLNFKLRAGQIDASEIPQAIDDIIKTVEQDKSYGEIVLDLQVRGQVTAAQARREANQARSVIADEYGQPIDLGVGVPDLSTAESVMLGWLNNVEGEKPVIGIEADDKAARSTFTTLTSDIEKARPTLNIYGKYIPDPNMPGGTPSGTPAVPVDADPYYATGGYIPGTRGKKRRIQAHAGEFVMRPEAVDRLGVGFLSALNQGHSTPQNNNVTVQSNFYAPVGMTETKEIILRTADDGARRIVDIMARGGYKLQ